jgi:hypothetical protein
MADRPHPAAAAPPVSVGRGRLVLILAGGLLGMLFAMLGQTIAAREAVVDEVVKAGSERAPRLLREVPEPLAAGRAAQGQLDDV